MQDFCQLDASSSAKGKQTRHKEVSTDQQVGLRLPTKRKRNWQRDLENSLLLNLTLDVNDLRQQVCDCIMKKTIRETRLLVAREQFHARSIQSVDTFFNIFRKGYREIFSVAEEMFLSRVVHKNVSVGGGLRGKREFFEQWRRYKLLFSVRHVRSFSTRVVASDGESCLIENVGEFEGRMTAAALQKVFLNSFKDSAMVKQVLGRRFVCLTKALISFDANECLVQYDAFSNVFEAMSKLLDFNMCRVTTLMGDVAIRDGSLLPSMGDGCQKESEKSDVSLVGSSTSS